MKKLLLGFLLHHANRDVSAFSKQFFYVLKTRILKKNATFIGDVYQKINRACWDCNGTGIYEDFDGDKEVCYNCHGTGIYSVHWTKLSQYKLGRCSFLIPIEILYTEPKAEVTIEGKVKHKPTKFHFSRECTLWLYLFYDKDMFWKELTKIYCPRQIRTPLVFIGNIINRIIAAKMRAKRPRYKAINPVCTEDDLPF